MYFYKNTKHQDRAILPSGKIENYEGRQRFFRYIGYFDFHDKIHPDKKHFLKNIQNRDITLIPDLAAAICSQLFKAGLFSTRAIDYGMEYIRDIVQNLNYEFVSDATLFARLASFSTKNVCNIIYVAGCQNETMLKQRVKKAAEFAYYLVNANVFSEKIKVVFSGRNPTTDNTSLVGIPNESSLMDILFTQFLEEIMTNEGKRFDPNLKFDKLETVMENNSQTTKENIKRLFVGDKKGEVKRNFLEIDRGNNIVLLSSSFHLIRLVKELEQYRATNEVQFNIENLVLVGSEKLQPHINIEDDHYIKLMFYEIFDHTLKLRGNQHNK